MPEVQLDLCTFPTLHSSKLNSEISAVCREGFCGTVGNLNEGRLSLIADLWPLNLPLCLELGLLMQSHPLHKRGLLMVPLQLLNSPYSSLAIILFPLSDGIELFPKLGNHPPRTPETIITQICTSSQANLTLSALCALFTVLCICFWWLDTSRILTPVLSLENLCVKSSGLLSVASITELK